MKNIGDAFNINALRLGPDQITERLAVVPHKIVRRRQQFIRVPWTWVERLREAHGTAYRVALCLLYLHWKSKGEPIRLANGMLGLDGVERHSKYRALRFLERRGLITVERQSRKSPVVRLVM